MSYYVVRKRSTESEGTTTPGGWNLSNMYHLVKLSILPTLIPRKGVWSYFLEHTWRAYTNVNSSLSTPDIRHRFFCLGRSNLRLTSVHSDCICILKFEKHCFGVFSTWQYKVDNSLLNELEKFLNYKHLLNLPKT